MYENFKELAKFYPFYWQFWKKKVLSTVKNFAFSKYIFLAGKRCIKELMNSRDDREIRIDSQITIFPGVKISYTPVQAQTVQEVNYASYFDACCAPKTCIVQKISVFEGFEGTKEIRFLAKNLKKQENFLANLVRMAKILHNLA